MDCTRLLSLAGTDGRGSRGRVVRAWAGIGTAAVIVAAPALATAQTQRSVDRSRVQSRTVEVNYDDDYYDARLQDRGRDMQVGGRDQQQPGYDNWRERELRRQHGQSTSYGDVNYEHDQGYGEFNYYGDVPAGRYQHEGSTWDRTLQPGASRDRVQQQRTRQDLSHDDLSRGDFYDQQGYTVRERQIRGTTSRDQHLLYDDVRSGRQLDHGASVRGEAGGIDSWYQQERTGMRQRQDLPRTRVYLEDASLTGRGIDPSSRYQNQPMRYEDELMREERMWRQRQQQASLDDRRQPAMQQDRELWGRSGTDAVSYGDVNYEEDLGYGEFSYYGDDGRYQVQGASQRLAPGASMQQGMATGMVSPGQPVKYYTTDWHEEETTIDAIWREGSER